MQERLFTTQPILLGWSCETPRRSVQFGHRFRAGEEIPKQVREMRNSRGEWETWPSATRQLLKDALFRPSGVKSAAWPSSGLRPALMEPDVLRRIGAGELVLLDDGQACGREQKVADELNNQLLAWLGAPHDWLEQAGCAGNSGENPAAARGKIAEHHTPVVRFHRSEYRLMVQVRLDFQSVLAHVDSHGVAMIRPPERQVVNATCAACTLHAECRN